MKNKHHPKDSEEIVEKTEAVDCTQSNTEELHDTAEATNTDNKNQSPASEKTETDTSENNKDTNEKSAETNTGIELIARCAELELQNQKLTEDLQKTKDAYLRAIAEFDNYRRRTNEERPKNMIFAKGDLAKDLFPVLDNFKLGIEAAEKQHPEAKTIIDGFTMIANQLKSALAQHGIVEISPIGEQFNPNEHESLAKTPSTDVPEDQILFVHRVGYKIGDRLLRPASVVIAGNPQA